MKKDRRSCGWTGFCKSVLLGAAFAVCVSTTGFAAGTWIQGEAGWSLVDAGGNRLTGWQEDNGAWYYLNEAGVMQTGWLSLDGSWYYLEDSGAMATGWKEVGGKYYYLDPSGVMQTSRHTGDDVTYSFRADGSLSEVRKKKNTGGGSFPVEFYDEPTQQLADTLNETKLGIVADDDDDDDEDYDEKSKKDYDKDKSYVIDGGLQAAAEHRLALATTRGYGNGKIPDEGYIEDYYKSIRSNYGSRRHMEIFLPLVNNASEAEEKLDARYGEDNRKRQDRLSYYSRIGIACREYNGKYQYMIELMK